jgi:putative ABC transport system permease protein
MFQDLRFAIRLLAKSPGFTLMAVITLAAGIGLNSAIFSVVNSVMLRPPPYKEPGRLAQIWSRDTREGGENGVVSPADFLDWRKQSQGFESMSAYRIWRTSLTTAEGAVQINGAYVSSNFFETLGVAPRLGRAYAPEEEQPGADYVVIVSYDFWQGRLGGRPDVIGHKLILDEVPHTIIGALGPEFRHPEPFWDQTAQIWRTLPLREGQERGSQYLRAIGRLKRGVAIEQAQAEMSAIASRLEHAYPASNTYRGVGLVSLREQFTGEVRRPLLILQGAVVFVLLIACVNVANLLLSRNSAREQEMAIRAALGAGRLRLIRLSLAEGLVLAASGAAAGLLLARWGLDFLISLAPREYFRLADVRMDGWALAFTLALSLLTIMLFGLAPAHQAAKVDINDVLKQGRRGSHGQRLRGVLVTTEIALAMALLAGAGLTLRSLAYLQNIKLGFDAENLLTMRIDPPKAIEGNRVAAFYERLLARVEALPGIKSAAVTLSLPLIQMNNMSSGVTIVGQPEPRDGIPPVAFYRAVSPGYFRTMDIPLLSGRDFNERDRKGATQVAIVNEVFARRYLHGADPEGHKIITDLSSGDEDNKPMDIVGVVADARHAGLQIEPEPEIYVPHAQDGWRAMTLAARTEGNPELMAPAAQSAIWEVERNASISRISAMSQIFWELLTRPRFMLVLLGVFATVALLLAAIGVYGVMSYTVAQTTREIGVRMALGAQTRDVMRLVMWHGMRWTLAGVGIGLVAAFGLTRLMVSLLPGVRPNDPATFAGVLLLLVAVAIASCYLPARRATKVDPMIALRYE